eukprot:scaffold4787_cov117-Isochrysis_galbana.AAC.4
MPDAVCGSGRAFSGKIGAHDKLAAPPLRCITKCLQAPHTHAAHTDTAHAPDDESRRDEAGWRAHDTCETPCNHFTL